MEKDPDMDTQGICILLFGPPGTGKSELGRKLQENHGLRYISTGDTLKSYLQIQQERKENDEEKSPVEYQMKTNPNSGELVEDTFVNKLLFNSLSPELVDNRTFVLDGYPRNKEQAITLKNALIMPNYKCVTIFLTADLQLLIQRLLDRSQKENREDDSPSIIQKRLEIFESKTLQVFSLMSNFYNNPSQFKSPIDTTQLTIPQVYDRVERDLKLLEIIQPL